MRIEGSNNVVGSGNQVSYSADGGAYERAKAQVERCAAWAIYCEQMASKWLVGGVGLFALMASLDIGGAWAVVPFVGGLSGGTVWNKRAELARAELQQVRLTHAVY